ncbi:Crp/Fnr family transcriptional regulator [Aquimarina aquimarini]|uniref:Crp/Fnr family transcriptional regulator n=1 Tax=Aquimarina aquimarini TaxID=1191734 RepID=UPI00131EDB02|nr:hypothetical protein [Aquimarina aquimarini]
MALKKILDSNPKLYNALKKKGEEKKYNHGDLIILNGSVKDKTAFIFKGLFKVTLKGKKPLLLYHIDSQNQCIISLMNFYTSSVKTSITSLEKSSLLWVSNADILELANSFPLLKIEMLSSYHYNNQQLLLTMDTIMRKSIEDRFIDYLLTKSSIYKTNKLCISWNEIASDLQISKTTVFKIIKTLKTKKQITLSEEQIIINKFSL